MTEEQATEIISELYEGYWSALVHYGWRISSSVCMAEDTVQEAFFDLYRSLRKGQKIENPKAWLLCVVRRKLFRQIKRHAGGSADPGMAEVLERSPAPYDPTVLPLTSLTPREQEVVLLRLSSLKYREIGARLNISAKTVSVLLTRAVRKLRQAVPGASSASEWKQVEDVEDRPETLQ